MPAQMIVSVAPLRGQGRLPGAGFTPTYGRGQSKGLVMKRVSAVSALVFGLAVQAWPAAAIEQPQYAVQAKDRDFELRTYKPYLVAEVVTSGDQNQSVQSGFRMLAGYIFGGNQGGAKIAMTSPVAQAPQGEKIAMTSPVTQAQQGAGRWSIQFMMPGAYTLETLPKPNDPDIRFRQVPARSMASLTFSGIANDRSYREKVADLRKWVLGRGLQVRGEPVLAQYDPPWTPWFMRRNEVLLEVADVAR